MKLLRFLLLPGLLCATLSCNKDDDDDPTPSKTALLTAVTWKSSTETMTLNGTAGTRTVPAADMETYQFAADGRLTITEGSKAPQTGTWAFANNETQLKTTGAGNANQTFEVFELSAAKMSFGVNYTPAQMQAALAPNSGDILPLLLLSAGNFTFPANTPPLTPAQLTSFRYQANMVPR